MACQKQAKEKVSEVVKNFANIIEITTYNKTNELTVHKNPKFLKHKH